MGVCFRSTDPPSYPESVTANIQLGLETYIPNSLKQSEKDKPNIVKLNHSKCGNKIPQLLLGMVSSVTGRIAACELTKQKQGAMKDS